MSDLAVRTNGWGLAEAQPALSQPRQDLAEWVAMAREVASIAEMLCRTSFVPKAFVGKPAECAAAILAGQEVNIPPMAALRAIDVIEGKPAMSALALRALVQSHGHETWVHETTATRAIVKGRRAGSDKVETSIWTLDRARTFGLLGKKNWREQPTAMLLARATAECARLVAADVLLGMPYSSEELADGGDFEAEATTEPQARPARRTAKRAQPKASAPPPADAPEPDFDDEPAVPAEELATPDQLRKLHTLFSERGITDRDSRLAMVALTIERNVDTSKDLTKREASRVIDALENPPTDQEPPPADDEPGADPWPEVAQPADVQDGGQ